MARQLLRRGGHAQTRSRARRGRPSGHRPLQHRRRGRPPTGGAIRLLVLGGTKFLGRHLVEAALGSGHEVTLFNRGQTNPDLFSEAEHLRGERGYAGTLQPGDGQREDLTALVGREWDAVLDTSGYFPRVVRASAELLSGAAARYVFVSSISVYADLSRPASETSPVGTLADETVEELGPEYENYGPLKALCERAVVEIFGERALVVRPGYIVGPHDPTDRFVYWPRRVARGGAMIAPGPPERPMQFIDARDLAEWMLEMTRRAASGVYNATNESISMGDLLSACPGDAEPVWATDRFLAEHGVDEQELPLWTGDPRFAAIHEVDVSKAVAAGLASRPVAETARETSEWDGTRTEAPPVGLTPEREAELLLALQA